MPIVDAIVCLDCLAYMACVLRSLSHCGAEVLKYDIHSGSSTGAQVEQISRVLVFVNPENGKANGRDQLPLLNSNDMKTTAFVRRLI